MVPRQQTRKVHRRAVPAAGLYSLRHGPQRVRLPHMSKEGGEVACAGYLLSQGAHNFSVRMARQRFDVSSDVPLYPTYRSLAIANGISPSDPCLRQCRDDGQMQSWSNME